MPRMPLHLASGTGIFRAWAPKVIRFVRYGCTNRHFYHIVIMERRMNPRHAPIEQLGTYDPCENEYNQKLVSFNFERIQHWLGQGNVTFSGPVEELMGLCGFLPIHTRTYMTAWRNRRAADKAAAESAAAAAAAAAASEGEKASAAAS